MTMPTSADILERIRSEEDIHWCAELMARSPPWVTLKRDYAASKSIMLDPTRENYLLREGERRLGFAIVTFAGPFQGYLQSLCISDDCRGQGIGTRMLRLIEELIFERSPNCFLCVSSFNPGAMQLYEREGYERIGELKNFIVDGHSEFLYRKTRGPLSAFQRQ
jgi:ribosomal protein S18 acetylase RimI-like enzyme